MKLQLLAWLLAGAMMIATSPAAAGEDCGLPVDGLEQLMERPGLRYVFVGEIHGTTETPAFVGDLACQVADRPLLVGVEWPGDNQSTLDAFMAEKDPDRARALLLRAPALLRPDGRGSRAMVEMLQRLWRLRNGGRWVRLVAFDYEIPTPGTSNEREAGMARLVRDAAEAHPEALVLILTGMGHADREGFTSLQPPVRSMIQHLPVEETTTMAMARVGGQALLCQRVEGAERCAPGPLTARDDIRPRGLGTGRPGFDALAWPGGVYTASPAGLAAHR